MTAIETNSITGSVRKSLFISCGIFFIGVLLLLLSDTFRAHKITLFISGFVLSFAGMLALRHFWPSRWGAGYVVMVAIAARALIFPVTPSDDCNRYIWEGNLQRHGMNPYRVAPDNPVTVPLRNEIWKGINHPEFTSIYGPSAQMVFTIAASFWYSPFGVKLMMVIFDMATILMLALLIGSGGRPMKNLLLYAANPLVLYSFAAEGHVEAMVLFMLAAAAFLHRKKHYHLMFFLLGCSGSVKLTSLIYLPLFMRKDTVKYAPFALLPLVFALPYGTGALSILDVTIRFAGEFRYNGCIFGLFSLVLDNTAALQVSTVLFVFAYMGIFFLTPDPVRGCGNVSRAFLLSAPTAHSWYFTAIAMFAVLYPARSWIVLTGSMGLGWLTIFKFWATGIWRESWYIRIIEYLLPLFPGIVGHRKRSITETGYNAVPEKISIIIPVLNEASRLSCCLQSIVLPEDVRGEILVVDGGSEDATREIAQADSRVRILTSECGRGFQVSRGIEEANGELIIVLHADSLLDANAVAEIGQFCRRHPHIAGGSVASRFNSKKLRYRFITALNNFRSRFTGISFGDQVQFFRCEVLVNNMPRVKLMEDIEISLRLKEHGPVAVVPSVARSSTRRWEKRAYGRNMLLVIGLTGLYIVKRRFGLLSNDNADFYRMYYGKT